MTDSHSQSFIRDEEIDLARLWGLLLSRWRLIGGTTLGALILALAYALLATPIYRADAMLQVEEKQGGMPGLGELSEIFVQQSSAQAEIELIRSRMVLGQAAERLRMDISVTRDTLPILGALTTRGEPIAEVPPFASHVDGSSAVVIGQLTLPPRLLNLPLELTAEGDGRFTLAHEGQTLLSGRVGEPAASDLGDVQLTVSHLDAEPGTRFIVTQRDMGRVVEGMRANLSVSETGRNTGILKMSYTGPSREGIQQTLDAIAEAYLMQNVRRLSAEAEKSLEFLNEQLPEIKADLQAAEEALNAFRQQSESVDLTLEVESMLKRLVEIEARLNELTFRESEINRLFTPEHPAYRTLMEQRNSLERERDRLNELVKSLPETQQQMLRLTRDMQVNQEIYVQLLNKAQELRVIRAGTVGNVRIIDDALVGPEPVKPKKPLIVVLAVMLGGMLGVAIVLVQAAFRRGIESAEALEREGINVYVTVPRSEKQEQLTVALQRRLRLKRRRRNRKSPIPLLALEDREDLAVESLRSLRTSLHFAMLGAERPVLMLTGSSPDVGKSFIAANLAIVLAQAGQRIVLIDADLRRGYLHESFSVDNRFGLSEWLAGRAELDALMHPTDVPGLSVIPRGMAPPNPAELLMRPKLRELLDHLAKNCDLVIIDTPPVLAVTDAAIIGREASSTLMVVRYGMNTLKEVQHAIRRFEQSGVSIRGTVLNGIERRAGAEGYYAYSYRSDRS